MLIRIIFIIFCVALLTSCSEPSVSISYDDTSRQECYAAGMLEKDCTHALELVKNIIPTVNDNRDLIYELADIRTWSYLGLHYAEKLRAAVALHIARSTGNEDKREEAIAHLEKGLKYWDEVIAITRPLYNDMPLTHLQGYGRGDRDGSHWQKYDNLLFHWAIIRPDVEKDIEIAKELK